MIFLDVVFKLLNFFLRKFKFLSILKKYRGKTTEMKIFLLIELKICTFTGRTTLILEIFLSDKLYTFLNVQTV